MSDKELKESIAKNKAICKSAESSILDMKVKLQKYKGDKTTQTTHLQNLDNLLNLAVKQGADIQTYEDDKAKLIMRIGELNYLLKEMTQRYAISEKINEVGVDEVVKGYFEHIKNGMGLD